MNKVPEYFDAENPPRIVSWPIDFGTDNDLPAVEVSDRERAAVHDCRKTLLAVFLLTVAIGLGAMYIADYLDCSQTREGCALQLG